MSLTLTDLALKQSRLKGYKPRIGISVSTLDKHFSPGDTFASDTQQFEGIINANPRAKFSTDRLGGIARNAGLNWNVLNQELFSNIFNTYPDPEKNVVDAFLYWDVADVVRNSLSLVSASNQYAVCGSDSTLHPDITAGAITVGMWVNFKDAAIGANCSLFENGADVSNYHGIRLVKDSNDFIQVTAGDGTGGGSGDRRTRTGTTAMVANRWYFIAGLFKSFGASFLTDSKIWINGVEEVGYTDSGTSTGSYATGSGKNVNIGLSTIVPAYSDIYCTHVGFWDVELSDADILSLYGDGTPKDLNAAASYDTDRTGDLQGWWDFNDRILGTADSPTQINDVGDNANDNHGTLTNSPLWSTQIPCCLDTDRIQFFKGVISDFPKIDYNSVNFKSNSFNSKTINPLCKTVNLSDYADAEAEAVGRPIPIVYGDMMYRRYTRTIGLWQTRGENNLVPMVRLNSTQYLIAGHALAHIDELYAWDSGRTQLMRIDSSTYTISNVDGNGNVLVTFDSPIHRYIDVWDEVVSNTDVGAIGTPVNTEWTDEENLVGAENYDITSFMTHTKDGADAIPDGVRCKVVFADKGIPSGSTEVTRTINFIIDKIGTNNNELGVYFDGESYNSGNDVITQHSDFDGITIQVAQSYSGSVLTDVYIYHYANAAAAASSARKVYSIWQEITYDIDADAVKMPLFASCLGLEYDTWINSRTDEETHADNNRNSIKSSKTITNITSGGSPETITTSAAHNFSVGDLVLIDSVTGTADFDEINGHVFEVNTVPLATTFTILANLTRSGAYSSGGTAILLPIVENGAGVIESLLRDKLSVTTSEINEDKFSIASNDLSTTKLAFALADFSESNKFFTKLLPKLFSILFYSTLNKFAMRTFVSGDPFTASGGSVANNQDIYEFDPQTTFKIVTGENDDIDLVGVDFGNHYITLDAGNYTGTSLATEIESEIDAEIGANEINVTYDSDTGKFTFTEVGGTEAYTINWLTGPSTGNSAGRFLGFDISANDSLGIGGTLTSNYPIWVNSFVENPIVDKSFSINKTKDKIFTTVDVLYGHNTLSDVTFGYLSNTDTNYHAETTKIVKDHKFTSLSATAQLYLDFLSKSSDNSGRMSRKYWVCKFKTWLNATNVELWDIINVRHPVINGLLGSATELTQKWLVIDIQYDLSDRFEVEITAVEI